MIKEKYENKGKVIRDVIFSIIIMLTLTVIVGLILGKLNISNESLYILAITAGVVINIFVTCLLNQRYPIKLFPKVYIKNIINYIIIGTIISLIVNFPYNAWSGNYIHINEAYSYFIKFGFLKKIWFILLLCVIGPTFEEILFRGFFYRLIRDISGVYWGAFISSVIFLLFHSLKFGNITLIVVTLVCLYVYEKTGSILTSIVVHALNNTFWLVFTHIGISFVNK